MTDQDRLAEIQATWLGDELHRPEYWAAKAISDVPWLVGEVERLRGLLRKIAWEGSPNNPGLCTACIRPGGGHEPGCWLAAEEL